MVITATNAFEEILDDTWHKPDKIWVDKSSEFYKRSMKSWLQDNNVEMCSTQNEGKSVVVERFFRTLKNKMYKYMTSILKNKYVDKLYNIVDEYNNTYHITIEMKTVDVKSSANFNFNKRIIRKILKLKLMTM